MVTARIPDGAIEGTTMASQHDARVLIVEDDLKLRGLLQEFLEASGFEVSVEERGDVAVERILAESPDIVILDVMLPGEDGFSVCAKVRATYDGLILMLTARGDESAAIVGLELGADDYVAKPAGPRLLLARMRALLRRKREAPAAPADDAADGTRIAVGELTVDAASRSATLGGAPVSLTTAEFDLLWLLAQHRGEVVSRDTLHQELRGVEYDGLDRSIDLRVARLRKKLGDDSRQPRLIKSVRAAGYLLVREP